MFFLAIITSLSRTIVLSGCYVCCCSVKFSLSGRDNDSNRFLSSWMVIPSTHPSIPRRRANGSPLVWLRNRDSDQRRTPRATTLPGRSELLTHLPLVLRKWSPAHRTSSGSAHFILVGLPSSVILLGFAVGTSYPANLVLGMCSTWQEDVQRSVLSCHRRSYYYLAKLRPA